MFQTQLKPEEPFFRYPLLEREDSVSSYAFKGLRRVQNLIPRRRKNELNEEPIQQHRHCASKPTLVLKLR